MSIWDNIVNFGKKIVDDIEGNNNGGQSSPPVQNAQNLPILGFKPTPTSMPGNPMGAPGLNLTPTLNPNSSTNIGGNLGTLNVPGIKIGNPSPTPNLSTPQFQPVHNNFFNPILHQLNQAGNGAVSDLKDIGDLGSLGVANLTGNQQAANNARNAIGNNNANLGGKNFATNLGGLSQDVGLTPSAKAFVNTGAGVATNIVNGLTNQNLTSQQAIGGGPLGGLTNWASNNGTVNEGTGRNLAGNAINTAINLLTLGKGKAIDQAAERSIRALLPQLEKSGLGKVAQKFAGSEAVAGLYGAGQGASQAAQSANNFNEAATDIGKGVVQGLPFGVLGLLPNATHGLINTANKVADATPDIINQTRQLMANQVGRIGINNVADNHPAVLQLNDHLDTLNKLRDNMTKNGLDERNPAMVNNAKAYQATLDELNNTRNAITQGGYAKIPGTPEPIQPVDDLYNQANPAPSAETLRQQAPKVETPQVETPKPINITKPKTGVVDKQLNQLLNDKSDIINSTADELMMLNKPHRNLNAEILSNGGISSSAYENIPNYLKRKTGSSADYMARNLGFPDEDALMEAINNQSKPLKRYQAVEQAEEDLQSGKHYLSDEYNKINNSIKQRQDELSQYPNGKYRQVKITNSPNKMSDEELASLNNTPEGQMPYRPNEIKKNDSIRIRNPKAEAQVLESIKNGKTTDEILNDYMNQTGANMDTAVHDVDGIMKLSGNQSILENPLRGKVKLPIAPDAAQAYLHAEMVTGQLNDARLVAKNAVSELNPHDLALVKDIESKPVEIIAKSAIKPEEFLNTVSKLRNYYDLRDAWDQYLGVEHGYRMNYLRQLVQQAETDIKQEPIKIGGGNKQVGYTNARSYQTLNTNVMDALDKEAGATHNLGKLAYEKGLENVYGDKIAKGNVMRSDNGTYKTLNTKYGKGLTASPEIANALNSRAAYEYAHGVQGAVLKLLDQVGGGYKGLKLAFGGFHDVVTMAAHTAREIRHGNLQDILKPLQSKFSSSFYNDLKEGYIKDGSMDKFRISGLTLADESIDSNNSLLFKGKYNPLRAVHDSLFLREIPTVKMVIAADEFKNLNINNPEDVVKMRQISKALNDSIGGANRAIDSFTPSQVKMLGRSILASDYNEGQFRATISALSKKGPEGRVARELIGGKIAIFAMPTLVSIALDPNKRKDAKTFFHNLLNAIVDPQVSTPFKNDKGEHQVIKFAGAPAITKSYRAVAPFFDSNNRTLGQKTIGLQHEITGNAAPLLSTANQLITNKDYYGNPVITRNDNGSINFAKSLGNVANASAPIAVNQIVQAAQGKQNPIEAVINISGIGRSATDTTDPQYVKNQNYFNTQSQLADLMKNGKLSQIDPSLQDVSASQGAKLYSEYTSLHPTATKDASGNSVPSDWNALSADQKASYYLSNDPKTGAQRLSPSFYIDQKLAQLDPTRPHSALFDLTGSGTSFTLDSNGNIIGTKSEPKAQIALDYSVMGTGDPERYFTEQANPWLKNYSTAVGNDAKNYVQNLTQWMQNQGWNQKAIDTYFQQHPSVTPPLTAPNVPQSTTDLMNQYDAITDPTQKQDFYVQNINVLQPTFKAIAQYDNQLRVAKGLLPLQVAPNPTPQVQALLDSMPKGSDSASKATRAQIINSSPELKQYLADSGLFTTTKDLSKYLYQNPIYPGATQTQLLNNGDNLAQSTLKGISNLGNYDIGKNANGQYSFMQNGSLGNGFTSAGGGGGSITKSHRIKRTKPVRIRQHRIKMKVHNQHLRYVMPKQRPLRIAKASKISPVRIKM